MSNAQVDPRQLQVDNPICPKCGRPMVIVRIEPDEAGHQKRTYECSECELVENLIVKAPLKLRSHVCNGVFPTGMRISTSAR
jgi:predicted RNA-binding Zn-ribbon protein involved in translation (DUF1610 family)